jgi:hypothetical protein
MYLLSMLKRQHADRTGGHEGGGEHHLLAGEQLGRGCDAEENPDAPSRPAPAHDAFVKEKEYDRWVPCHRRLGVAE